MIKINKMSDFNNKIEIMLRNKTKNIKQSRKSNLNINKNNSFKSSFSSNEYDIDKQGNLSNKKLVNNNMIEPIFHKIIKSNSQKILSINKKLINDLNFQINNTNKKIFSNDFIYKQTINLQELNDYIIFERTKKNIQMKKNKGLKNTIDFRMPLIFRRIANHYKKEDLIPMKSNERINLEDILINHNSIFRKAISQNSCRQYYLKNNIKIMNKNLTKIKKN